MQDAGTERVLRAGFSYDVSDTVGRQLVRSGMAEFGERSPETKPNVPPSIKRGRRR